MNCDYCGNEIISYVYFVDDKPYKCCCIEHLSGICLDIHMRHVSRMEE